MSWIWLVGLFATLAGVSFDYAAAIKCLVCSSDKALGSSMPLYHKNCRSPSKDWQSKPHSNIWDCKDYDTLMGKALAEWRKNANDNSSPSGKSGPIPPNCPDYSVCRSMYYEAGLEYQLLSGDEMYKMVDDKEHVIRFCGCLYSPENKTQADLVKKEFNGKATKCDDEIKGKVRKRRCLCDPKHSSFSGILACNFAPQVQPYSMQIGCFLTTGWLLISLILQK